MTAGLPAKRDGRRGLAKSSLGKLRDTDPDDQSEAKRAGSGKAAHERADEENADDHDTDETSNRLKAALPDCEHPPRFAGEALPVQRDVAEAGRDQSTGECPGRPSADRRLDATSEDRGDEQESKDAEHGGEPVRGKDQWSDTDRVHRGAPIRSTEACRLALVTSPTRRVPVVSRPLASTKIMVGGPTT